MEEESKVVLHSQWSSTYGMRVELALKLKGIPYEYVEEDLQNKSQLLIKLNPVYKKVPVLIHDNKPIVESFVILEYIDETWPNGPRLYPEDPYERAKVRFWAGFMQQILDSIGRTFFSQGEELEKRVKEVDEKMTVFEEGAKRDLFPNAVEEVVSVKIMNLEKHLLIASWFKAVHDLPLVKEITPPHEKLVAMLQSMRQTGAM